MKFRKTFLLIINYSLLIIIVSCSVQKKLDRAAKKEVLTSDALATAHVGISIYEPATGKYWYNYDGDKYFVPASNTKIPTCYAAMKYLGDSLVGLRYGVSMFNDRDSLIIIQPSGDPTFLLSEFTSQRVLQFFSERLNNKKTQYAIMDTAWRDNHWGSGWSWSDYDAAYMAERSSFPIFGNTIDITINPFEKRGIKDTSLFSISTNKLFRTPAHYFDSLLNSYNYFLTKQNLISDQPRVTVKRKLNSNEFMVNDAVTVFEETTMPFVTYNNGTARTILSDKFKIDFGEVYPSNADSVFSYVCSDCRLRKIVVKNWYKIHSQPTDSVLKPMMHRSDNFFAEQMLLMVSNEQLGYMSDAAIIDTLLKTDFKDLPQRPRWVDGSGLSRYNLFTPQDMVAILTKMENEFGMERIKDIFPTGGEGTLSNYYASDKDFIFAKTGTLSGVVAISGFITTKKNKQLVFSVLVNNHNTSATAVRRAVERYIHQVRAAY